MIKVVMVEDDPMVLEVNKGFLKKIPSFHLIDSVKDGRNALQSIKTHKPDLVLLDMYLPEISGLDVLTEIRTHDIPTDVLMITAARDAKTVHKVFRLGAVDYIVKPFRFDRFRLALEKYQKMWKKLMEVKTISQEDIDHWIERDYEGKSESLPKGISDITLKQIMMALIEQDQPVTAEQLANDLGMARVTVRRYLEYLVQQNKIRVEIEYGSVGRPKHYYSI